MAGEGWADDEAVMETEMTSLPGKRNCCDRMAGEGWADDEGVMEPEVIMGAGDEGVEELQDDVLELESGAWNAGNDPTWWSRLSSWATIPIV